MKLKGNFELKVNVENLANIKDAEKSYFFFIDDKKIELKTLSEDFKFSQKYPNAIALQKVNSVIDQVLFFNSIDGKYIGQFCTATCTSAKFSDLSVKYSGSRDIHSGDIITIKGTGESDDFKMILVDECTGSEIHYRFGIKDDLKLNEHENGSILYLDSIMMDKTLDVHFATEDEIEIFSKACTDAGKVLVCNDGGYVLLRLAKFGDIGHSINNKNGEIAFIIADSKVENGVLKYKTLCQVTPDCEFRVKQEWVDDDKVELIDVDKCGNDTKVKDDIVYCLLTEIYKSEYYIDYEKKSMVKKPSK